MKQGVSQLVKAGDVYALDGSEVRPGDHLSVLVYDGLTSTVKWIDTTMQVDADGFLYLDGIAGYQISGLFARRTY